MVAAFRRWISHPDPRLLTLAAFAWLFAVVIRVGAGDLTQALLDAILAVICAAAARVR